MSATAICCGKLCTSSCFDDHFCCMAQLDVAVVTPQPHCHGHIVFPQIAGSYRAIGVLTSQRFAC